MIRYLVVGSVTDTQPKKVVVIATETSRREWENGIITRQMLAIEPLISRLLNLGQRLRAPIGLPEHAHFLP